jgi:hypothetical protein
MMMTTNLQIADPGMTADAVDRLIALEQQEEEQQTGAHKKKNLLNTQEQQEKATFIQAEKARMLGASKETLVLLAGMAKNVLHFAELCAEWEAAKNGVRQLRTMYKKAVEQDRPTITFLAARAWRARPVGCYSLRGALLHQSKLVLAQMRAEEKHSPRIPGFKQELREIHEALQTKAGDQVRRAQMVCPGAGGFVEQQTVAREIADIEFHQGGPIDKLEKERRWPCTRTGWPDVQPPEAGDKEKTATVPSESIKVLVEPADVRHERFALTDFFDEAADGDFSDGAEGGFSDMEEDAPPLVDRRFDPSPARKAAVGKRAAPAKPAAPAQNKKAKRA